MSDNYRVDTVGLNRIYLDTDNPRHAELDNEQEVIHYLLNEENIKQLARDIAERGSVSPLERIAVVAHPSAKKAYITAEGNRRVCALKLLADPDKAPTEAHKKYFRALAEKVGQLPREYEVVIFEDMDAARPWIALRHEGGQDGVGVRAWDSAQKARFHAQGGGDKNPNVQSYLLMQYAATNKLLPQDQIERVSITTLTRFLSNPVVRDAIGLIDAKTLNITVASDEFDRVISRFISDSLDPSSGVHSRTDAKQRVAYAGRLREEGVAPTTRGLEPYDVLVASQSDGGGSSGKDGKKKRNNRSPDDRRSIIPASHAAHINHAILKRFYDELRRIDAEVYPFASNYLLRAVIELSAVLFLRKRGIAPEKDLHKKLGKVAEKLLGEQALTDQELKFYRAMANDKEFRFSTDMISHFVHGGAIPTRVDSIRLWDSIEPVMKVLFSKIE